MHAMSMCNPNVYLSNSDLGVDAYTLQTRRVISRDLRHSSHQCAMRDVPKLTAHDTVTEMVTIQTIRPAEQLRSTVLLPVLRRL